MKKTIIFLALATICFGIPLRAQYNETNNLFYHTLRTPQSTLYNPAFFPTSNSFYLMLPGLDFQFGSPLAMNDIIYYDKASNTTVINIDSMLHALNEDNQFRLGANVNLLGFGFKVKNTYFNFNTRLVNSVNLALPISTISALLDGNISDDGSPVSEMELVNGDILNATSYVEAGVGLAHKFESINLTVGARAKLLYGVANMQTDNTKIVINTDPNMDSVSAKIYYQIQSSTFAPYDTSKHQFIFNLGDIISLGKANTGLAFDLGAKYELGPFTFSVAINDLTAGIHWKSNVNTWRPQGGQGVITFNGVDINTLLDNGTFNADSLTNYLQDKLDDMTPTMLDSGDYWFSVPTKINVGASFSFARFFRAGLLFHGQFDRGLLCKSNSLDLDLGQLTDNTFRFNSTLSLGANLFNWAEVIVGSSVVYDGEKMSFFNPGLGLVLSVGTVAQFYLMSDFISNIYLTESKAFNLKLGLNVLLGKGDKKVITTVDES